MIYRGIVVLVMLLIEINAFGQFDLGLESGLIYNPKIESQDQTDEDINDNATFQIGLFGGVELFKQYHQRLSFSFSSQQFESSSYRKEVWDRYAESNIKYISVQWMHLFSDKSQRFFWGFGVRYSKSLTKSTSTNLAIHNNRGGVPLGPTIYYSDLNYGDYDTTDDNGKEIDGIMSLEYRLPFNNYFIGFKGEAAVIFLYDKDKLGEGDFRMSIEHPNKYFLGLTFGVLIQNKKAAQ